MNFKKTSVAATVFASLIIVSQGALAAAAADVTLGGVITATTCDISVNGGQSTLDVGIFKRSDFVANTKLGNVTLPVTLSNCSDDEKGSLIVKGTTSTGNAANNIFVSNNTDTVGFMINDASGKTLTNGNGPTVDVTAADGGSYNFTVGMASSTKAPATGAYSAPITVAYIVN